MSGRRFEDSVVVSIDQVRDMLRDETRPAKPAVAEPVPMARPVPPEVAAGVPSFAEVAARRQERWESEPIGQAPVVRVTPRGRWKGPVLAAVVGAVLAGGAVFGVHAAEGEPAPFAPAAAAYEEAVDNAVLQAELRVAQAEAEAARVRIKALEGELDALRAAAAAPTPSVPGAAVADAKPVAKSKKKARSKKRRARSKKRRARSKKRTSKRKRRPKRKMTGSDKKLDALIDGL